MGKRRVRKSTRRRKIRRGGGATALPGAYFGLEKIGGPPIDAGKDLLRASGNIIRSAIGMSGGGKRRKTMRKRGGFLPSVMGSFATSVSKYITPIALFAGYKLMTRKGTKKHRKSHKRR